VTKLVKLISESVVGRNLRPWTSMYDLRVTQTPAHPFQDGVPYLQIKPYGFGKIEYRYSDTNFLK